MSYDLAVFDTTTVNDECEYFLDWYRRKTEWKEGLDYSDYKNMTVNLRAFFVDMTVNFPAMNGKLSILEEDSSKVTDYCCAGNLLHMAFAWSVREQAYNQVTELAKKHQVGFYDVSG